MKKFRHFGVMLDCSRDGVMKVSAVKQMIDCLHKMGYNTLELYTEDTYEIDGEPYFGYLRGRYTKAELKEIDAYAKSKGIELIPCIQTLAHYTALVRHIEYADIVDVNDILLIDEPKTYELIDKIFATIAKRGMQKIRCAYSIARKRIARRLIRTRRLFWNTFATIARRTLTR